MFLHESQFEIEGAVYTLKKQRYSRLPKGFIVCDYCITDNLLEVENQTDGNKFWLSPLELLKRDYVPGKEEVIMRVDMSAVVVILIGFTTTIFRNICYVKPIFKEIRILEKYEFKPSHR